MVPNARLFHNEAGVFVIFLFGNAAPSSRRIYGDFSSPPPSSAQFALLVTTLVLYSYMGFVFDAAFGTFRGRQFWKRGLK